MHHKNNFDFEQITTEGGWGVNFPCPLRREGGKSSFFALPTTTSAAMKKTIFWAFFKHTPEVTFWGPRDRQSGSRMAGAGGHGGVDTARPDTNNLYDRMPDRTVEWRFVFFVLQLFFFCVRLVFFRGPRRVRWRKIRLFFFQNCCVFVQKRYHRNSFATNAFADEDSKLKRRILLNLSIFFIDKERQLKKLLKIFTISEFSTKKLLS